ncbi:MAG: hypothetical protein H7838_05450 [Magnetococcus sp. DMHC-8]
MNWFRPGQKIHRIAQVVSLAWWRRRKKAAVPSDQQGRLRARHKPFAHKLDGSQGPKPSVRDALTPRRGATSSDPRWGMRVREMLTGLTEGVLLRVVALLIILKNVVGFWRDLWLSGQELLARWLLPAPVNLESFAEEVQAGRLKSGCHLPERGPNWERPEPDPAALTGALVHPVGLREEVERVKMSILDTEEEDLPDDLLEDQAGALRSRLAGVVREEETK